MIGIMHYTRFYAFAILLLQIFVINESKMRITEIDTQASYDITIFNGLPWDTTTTMNQLFSSKNNSSYIPIIGLDVEFKGYNPCDERTMTAKQIEPYLDDFFATNSQFKREDGWFASFGDYDEITSRCDGNVPVYLIYPSYAARAAQNVGADGAFWLISRNNGEGSGIAATNNRFLPPDTDNENQMVLGTKITIPFFTMELFQTIDGEFLNIGAVNYRWSISLIPSAPQSDENPYEVLSSPTGIYRFVWAIIGVSSLLLAPIISKNCVDVFLYYRKKKEDASRVAFQMRMVILIPELLNSLVRILVAIDPFGAFYIFNFVHARVFHTLSNSLSTFTDIAMVIYCWDIYNVYKSSRSLQKGKPFLLRHKIGARLLLLFVFLMMIVDMVVLLLGLYGYLGSDMVVIPFLYMVLVNTIVVTALFKTASLMKREVKLVLEGLEAPKVQKEVQVLTNGVSKTIKSLDKSTLVPTPAVSKNPQADVIRSRTETFLKMRQYIILAAFSRLATIVAYLMIGSNLCYLSAFVFGFTLSGAGISSVLSSYFQVFSAFHLPRSKVKKVNNVVDDVHLVDYGVTNKS